jgi:hypothetical protein
MTPVTQEFLHDPDNGVYGDCQRAVIASLLDLKIDAVPHFIQISNNDPGLFWDELQKFCRSHGYVHITTNAPAMAWGDAGDVFHEISGPSPRGNGVFHAVVGKDGQIVFDPHPSRAGLAGDPSEWKYAYLVKA